MEGTKVLLQFQANVSDVAKDLKNLQSQINKLTLGSNLTSQFKKAFDEAKTITDGLYTKLSNGAMNDNDVKDINKEYHKLMQTMSDLTIMTRGLSKEQLKTGTDVYQELVKAQQALTDAEKAFENFKPSGIENVQKAIGNVDTTLKKASENTKKFISSLGNVSNIDEASEKLAKLQTRIDKTKKADDSYSDLGKYYQGIATKLSEYIDNNTEAFNAQKAAVENTTENVNVYSKKTEVAAKALHEDLNSAILETSGNIRRQSGDFKNYGEDMSATAKEVEHATNSILRFFSIGSAVSLFKRSIREAYNSVKELDAAMTETAVVTNFSVADMWDQMPEYTRRANQLGVTIKDVYEASTLYYQQGLNTNQVMQVTNATLKMARIAGLDAADATDRMTNALRGFNMEINETNADRIADVYSKLAAITASNVDEISTAMTKVASLASSANMQFETTAAFLAQIIETTRESAETAGTALKTVTARFSEVKKLYDKNQLTGQDEEGELIDVNKVQTALRTAGIDMSKYFLGEVGLDQIFLQLAERWDSLDVIQQRYIATQAAGSRQQSRFIAMMQDYTRTQELVEAANNSAGASTQQYEKTLDSLETKLNRLDNAWTEFTTSIANSNLIKGAVDGINGLVTVINNLTSAFGASSGALKILITGVGLIGGSKLAKTLRNNLSTYGTNLSEFNNGRTGLNSFLLSAESAYDPAAKERYTDMRNYLLNASFGDETKRAQALKTLDSQYQKLASSTVQANAKTQKFGLVTAGVGTALSLVAQQSKLVADALREQGKYEDAQKTEKFAESVGKVGSALSLAGGATAALAPLMSALGGSFAAAVPIVGAITLGLGTLFGLVDAFTETSSERQKRLAEEAAEAQERINEATTALEVLDEIQKSLDDDAFKGLIEGTKEYNEQLKKSQELVQKLKETNALGDSWDTFYTFGPNGDWVLEDGVTYEQITNQIQKNRAEEQRKNLIANAGFKEGNFLNRENGEIDNYAKTIIEVAKTYLPRSDDNFNRLVTRDVKHKALSKDEFGRIKIEDIDKIAKEIADQYTGLSENTLEAMAFGFTDDLTYGVYQNRNKTSIGAEQEAIFSSDEILNLLNRFGNDGKFVTAGQASALYKQANQDNAIQAMIDVFNSDLDGAIKKTLSDILASGDYSSKRGLTALQGSLTAQGISSSTIEALLKTATDTWSYATLESLQSSFGLLQALNSGSISQYAISQDQYEAAQRAGVGQNLFNKNLDGSYSYIGQNLIEDLIKELSAVANGAYNDIDGTTKEQALDFLGRMFTEAGFTGSQLLEYGANADVINARFQQEELQPLLGQLQEFYKGLETDQTALKAHAITIAQEQKELEDFAGSLKSNLDTIQNSDKNSSSYMTAMSSLVNSARKAFNWEDLSAEFIEENLEQFTNLLSEDAEVINSAFDSISANVTRAVVSEFDLTEDQANQLVERINDLKIRIATDLDPSGAKTEFVNMLDEFGIEAEQSSKSISALFSGLFITISKTAQGIAKIFGIKTNFSEIINPNTGGSKTSSGSTASKTWINPYLESQNTEERIAESQRQLNLLQQEYNKLLAKSGTIGKELEANQVKRLANLRNEIALQTKVRDQYLSEMRSAGQENIIYNGSLRSYASLGVSQYAWYDESTKTIKKDIGKIDQVERSGNADLGSAIQSWISTLESRQKNLENVTSILNNLEDTVKKIEEEGKQERIDLETRLLGAVVKMRQDTIDAYSTYSDSLNSANSNILKSLQEQISLERQIRDNTKKEQDISDKQAQLAYLQRDTSGANRTAVLQLQKELDTMSQSYSDTLVDQSLQSLQDSNAKALEQRQAQIDLMTKALDLQQKEGLLWEDVYTFLDKLQGDDSWRNSPLVSALQNTDGFQAMSALARNEWWEKLENSIASAYEYNQQQQEKMAKGESGGTINNSSSTSVAPNGTYTVQQGDTLSKIAQKVYGNASKWTELKNIDGSTPDPMKLYAGQVLKYANGGLVNKTGLAWLDGTKSSPEMVLNAKQTEVFMKFTDVLGHVFDNLSGNNGDTNNSNVYVDLDINVSQLANDYDVQKLTDKIKSEIYNVSTYRNINSVSLQH